MNSLRLYRFLFFGLVGVFFLFVALYRAPFQFRFLIKAAPILLSAVWVFINIPGKKGKLLGIGYLFSALGDSLLDIDRERLFVWGLFSFLVAHVFYVLVFFPKPVVTKSKGIALIVLLGYGIIMGFALSSRTGELLIPVLCYVSVIIAMGVSAIVGSTNHWQVVLGALLFIVSDSIIAINQFIIPIPTAGLWIMVSYYLAQYYIASGSFQSQS